MRISAARRPGVYTVSALSSLVDALFASGGPTVQGSMRQIQLRRWSAVVTEFDLYGLLIHGDKSKDVKLQSGDVIFIPPAGPQAAVTGSVRNPMVQHFGLREEYDKKYFSDARKKFEKRTKVDGSGKDGLIHISIEDQDPKRAAELANGYVEQFRNLSQHIAITEASQRRLFFEQELEQAKNNLAAAEEALKQTEQTTGLIELSSHAKALIESAATLRAQITAREVQIQGMQTYATGENAQLVQAQRELEGLRAQLARMGGSEDNASAGFIVPKGKVPEASLEYVRKLRDVKYSEAIFEILARQFEFAKLDEARQGALIQVVDPAIAPDKRSFPLVIPIVIVSALVGFFLGIFAALFQAGYRRLKEDPGNALKFNHLRKAFSFKG
jgi:uncharacterized protein involved in exopolysaccharide biosynthesis